MVGAGDPRPADLDLPTASPSLASTRSPSPTIRISRPARTRPWLIRARQASASSASTGGCATDATGDVSVIPHAWTIRTPISSNPRISASGTADPPHGTSRSELRSDPCSFVYRRTSDQIVGTAPATVGRSASISRTSGSACMNRSGMASEAPAMTAA